MRTHVFVVALAAALTVTGGAAAAAPSQSVGCGETVTGNAHLERDLRCPAGQGITLAGDATLDLRGHRLSGPGGGADESVGRGVSLSTQGTSRVFNGTIQGWARGIGRDPEDVDVHPSARISDVRLLDNWIGVYAVELDADLTRVTVVGGRFGVTGFSRPIVTVTDSVIRDAEVGASSGEGRLVVTRSRLTGNGTAVGCSESRCDLDRNHVALNGTGVSVGNFAQVNARGNVFLANRAGIVQPSPTEEPSSGVLTGNTLAANGDGIHLPAAAGFSLGGNRAFVNRRHGIYAPGATDLGGNRAAGNGNQPQCVGVAC